MSNLDHFMQRFVHANKQKSMQQQAAQSNQRAEQVQKASGNVVTNAVAAKITTKTTTRMTDDEYRKYIIAAAIEHIIKQRGEM